MALDAPALEDEAPGRGGNLLMSERATTIFAIAALLEVDPPSSDGVIRRISGISTAEPDTVVFAVDNAALDRALAGDAGLILTRPGFAAATEARLLRVADPRAAFARVYRQWFDERGGEGIHPSAVIGAGAVLGAGCQVGAGAVIEDDVQLGRECLIGPRVTIHSGTALGDRVRVQSGAVLGSDGFGYVREPSGYFGFPQIGTLKIGDDVEIGANTTIDRGALGETRIGRGTKIDNLVHIAHNCVIGEDVLMAAQVGMAGSTTIEDGAMLGGQVGLGERVTIGRGVILGGQGGVLPGKRLDGEGEVYWGTPARKVRDYLRDLARVRRK